MLNAKAELEEILKKENISILQIDCNLRKFTEIGFVIKELDFIEDFDFTYDEYIDWFDGQIYCEDNITNEPVWLERVEEFGRDVWEAVRLPKFYHKFLNLN